MQVYRLEGDMTISYSDTFGRLLLRWKGSLWKAIWKDMIVFIVMYYVVYFSHSYGMNDKQREEFRKVRDFFEESTGYIPLTFLLGFFVFAVVARWWDQFNYISWPDKLMIHVTTYICGNEYRMIRRTIARWANLLAALAWRGISMRTIKRFPTEEYLVSSGLMTRAEKEVYDKTDGKHGKWFLPVIWINSLLMKCHNQKIIDSVQLKNLMKVVESYRVGFAMLYVYDWVSVPLVYTQVVAIATYGYFLICIIGRQMVEGDKLNIHVPIFTILQFLFYMGWLKVGQALMNPFGEDDDDFELNYILDRNIHIAYLLSDDVHGQIPDLEKDVFWDQSHPTVPHTKASSKVKDVVPRGHLTTFKMTEDDMQLVDPDETQPLVEKGGERFQNLVRTLSQRGKGTRSREGTLNRDRKGDAEKGQDEMKTLNTDL